MDANLACVENVDGNYIRMLRAILNKSSTKQQLYGHLPLIMKTIQVRRTRHAGHCWRSKDELISDVLQWTPPHGRAKTGQTTRTYIQQLCTDTGCSIEDFPAAMDDRDRWWERVREIGVCSVTWWWWWWWIASDQLSWVIWYQIHPCRWTAVVLFVQYRGINGFIAFLVRA